MYTIANNYKYELIIKNSRFITNLYKINSLDDINKFLELVKEEYPGATHYCYGYVLDEIKKASDDGEPSGTAGVPILKVIESNNLTNVLIVVVRYFGGIKLGANGLIRAYTKCTANAIKEVNLKEVTPGVNVDITFNYDRIKEIDYLLKDIKINNKIFDNLITYNIDINLEFLKIIKNNNVNYSIIRDIKIEK